MGIYAIFLRNALEQPNPEVALVAEVFAHGTVEYDMLDAGQCFVIDGTQYHFTGQTNTLGSVDVAYFAPLTVPTDVSKDICRCIEDPRVKDFDFTMMLKKDHDK